MQGAVYGSQRSVLDADTFREVVDYKVAEHRQRRVLTRRDQEKEGEEGLKGLLH
jgi:ATPase family AAA domain-containing protein 3A/B